MTGTDTREDSLTREITIEAPVEDVWEALSTDDGRARWLEADDDRRLAIEEARAPSQISWWWWDESDDEPARHVEIRVVAVPDGTRVTVTETQPVTLPLPRLQACFEIVCA